MASVQVVLCVVVLAALAHAARVPRDDSKYTTKYDNINLDEILKSDRLLLSYTKCLLDTGKCSPDGVELKKSLPDALTNECLKCSKTQKDGAEKVVNFLIKNKNAIWKELEAKYDPQGVYIAKYDAELKRVSEAAAASASA